MKNHLLCIALSGAVLAAAGQAGAQVLNPHIPVYNPSTGQIQFPTVQPFPQPIPSLPVLPDISTVQAPPLPIESPSVLPEPDFPYTPNPDYFGGPCKSYEGLEKAQADMEIRANQPWRAALSISPRWDKPGTGQTGDRLSRGGKRGRPSDTSPWPTIDGDPCNNRKDRKF